MEKLKVQSSSNQSQKSSQAFWLKPMLSLPTLYSESKE